MASTTGTFNFYDNIHGDVGKSLVDLDGDAFSLLLTTSSYTPNAATHTMVSDITNEVSGNGYARQVLASVAYTEIGPNGLMRFDSADPVFTASGGSIVARYWVLFSNANGSDATRELLAYGLLDNTPADVTTTDGNTLTVNVDGTNGWFTLGGA